MANLLVTADHRIQFAVPGHLHQVAAVFLQCLIVLFRILAGDPLIPSHLGQSLQEPIPVDPILAEDRRRRCPLLIQKRQIQVLHADVVILKLVRLLLCLNKELT